MSDALLQVRELHTELHTPRGTVYAVNGVNFELGAGAALGIVGESGSGKSVLARTIARLLPGPPYASCRGSVLLGGVDLLALDERALRDVRGRRIGMVFQDPMGSLNPTQTIGLQITQVLRRHGRMTLRQARERATELLAQVGLHDPRQRLDDAPHQLSGGMRQRVVIAIALAGQPQLLIADEPTTALDVTVQARVLELLRRLQEQHRMALLLISHNLGVVAQVCERVAVMYGGQMVEQAPVRQVFARPRMRYTQALMRAMPRLDARPHERLYAIEGRPPSLMSAPAACPFAPRCEAALERCRTQPPPVVEDADGSFACWNPPLPSAPAESEAGS
ncbi:MAG: ABC transporter ATP-binding protein [Rubrivivax sp.]